MNKSTESRNIQLAIVTDTPGIKIMTLSTSLIQMPAPTVYYQVV
jgi:hypothetical protein